MEIALGCRCSCINVYVFSVVTCFVGFMEEDGGEDKEVA